MVPLFGFGFSPYDTLLIAIIALLFFGNRLPSVMRSLGQGVTEFKKGMAGIEEDETAKKDPPRRLDDSPKVIEERAKSPEERVV